jgi:NitT/TauT family transport system substrate-binding protein
VRSAPCSSVPVSLLLACGLVIAACGGDDDASADAAPRAESEPAEPVTLRLGYFPNVTHAPGVLGVENANFEAALGDDVTLEVSTFNAGPAAVEAIFGDATHATFIGPNPAINAYAQSQDEAIRIVSGTSSGGAYLVTDPDVREPRRPGGQDHHSRRS